MNSEQYNDFYFSLDVANGYQPIRVEQHNWHIREWRYYLYERNNK